jgi:hypothetical protein
VLISQIMIVGLFALSLDLILGYAGIVSLGHAAFFGLGAYTAGLLSVHGWGEPISGLFAAALVAGVCRLHRQLPGRARPGPGAADGHARHRPDAVRSGQQGGLHHRRRRRPVRHGDR